MEINAFHMMIVKTQDILIEKIFVIKHVQLAVLIKIIIVKNNSRLLLFKIRYHYTQYKDHF